MGFYKIDLFWVFLKCCFKLKNKIRHTLKILVLNWNNRYQTGIEAKHLESYLIFPLCISNQLSTTIIVYKSKRIL